MVKVCCAFKSRRPTVCLANWTGPTTTTTTTHCNEWLRTWLITGDSIAIPFCISRSFFAKRLALLCGWHCTLRLSISWSRSSIIQSVGQAKRVYGWSATTVSRGTTAGHYRGGGPRNWLIHIDWQVLLDDAVGFMLLHLCFGYCGTWRWHSFNIKQSINWLRREIYRYPETSCGGAFTSHVNHEWIESRHESKHADFYNRNSRIVLFVDLS